MSFLSKPYPAPDTRIFKIALVSLGLGAFVALFLILFKPFDTSEATMPGLNLFLGGYGIVVAAVTFIPTYLMSVLAPNQITEDRWTIGRQILYLFIIIGLGISASYFYLLLSGGTPNWTDYFYFFRNGLLVASFPIVILTLLDYIRKLRYYESGAEQLNAQRTPSTVPAASANTIELTDSQGRIELKLSPNDLWCLHSDGNYVEVWTIDQDKQGHERTLIRNTISELSSQLPVDSNFILCHRSWVVNIDLVESVSGNAQGYRLHRENAPTVVVARGRSKEVMAAIQQD
ncbi:hypothetical protein CEQ90_09600 [Lewinellaceae bacterium SD302]|nr:hypothetical protein CEQ90_09600 [Lewinellaceae bacterium SD302]